MDRARTLCRTSTRLLGLAFALPSLVVMGMPGPSEAQTTELRLPPALPGDRVLLMEATDVDHQLWSVATDGSDRQQLTAGESDFAPRWSPDGAQIAFHRVGDETTEPWVMAADGSDARRLAPAGYSPSWSPEGRRVALSTAFAGSPGPLRIAATDSGVITDVPNTAGAVDPEWSPDGSRITFVRTSEGTEDPSAPDAVAVVRTDGSALREIPVEQLTGSPAWSPDGQHVAFAAAPLGEPYGLYTVRRDGTALRLVVRDFGGISPLEGITAPAWAPGGDRLAFSALHPDGGSQDVYMVSSDGEDVWHPAPSDADDRVAEWTSDGEAIVFTRAADASMVHSDRDAWLLRLDEAPAARRITETGRSVVSDVGPGLTMRVGGSDRIATATRLSDLRAAADTVVIARADAFPDALAGAPLAAALDAPVLLTGSERLDDRVAAEIRRLGATTAYLLGGEAALSAEVAADLGRAGVTQVERLAGTDRFGTAQRVAEAVVAITGADSAYVVEGAHADEGRGWPDAVSVSALAALEGRPILLVTHATLPEATRAAVEEMARATVVGGTGAVSDEVEQSIAATGAQVDRVAGSTRYGTSAALADNATAVGANVARPWLATGRNWPDALAAGPTVAADGGVLLLVDGHGLSGSPATRDRLAAGSADRVVLVGGAGVIRPSARTEVERLSAARPD